MVFICETFGSQLMLSENITKVCFDNIIPSVASLSTHFPIDLTLFYFPFFFLNPPSQTFVSQLFIFFLT